jgi:glyoxylase-like metal-dependent hydrolase (beta-lactamase superfamily II)
MLFVLAIPQLPTPPFVKVISREFYVVATSQIHTHYLYSGRNLREIDFSDSIEVGQFRAYDFFGDGSFYLVDTPGHAVGHLSALARTTTSPDTFIFMGGDLCHHSGQIRPSKHMPLPFDIQNAIPATVLPCPGAQAYEKLLLRRNGAFFTPATMVGTDSKTTIRTIEKAQDADADSNIWFIFAHDPSLLGIVDLFPLPANDWKKNGWRRKTLWAFLRDFDMAIAAQDKEVGQVSI